jgi:hypothetical protein
MIRGDPYTQAAGIWPSGVLLDSMATGMLPFDDDDLHTLLRKIVTHEPQYRSFLSASLIELLRQMLTKDPEGRITLEGVKAHRWFSQAQYAALWELRLSERATDAIVDPDVVEAMAMLGIETANIRQQLLLGAVTEVTAIYRMMRRQRLTDALGEKITALAVGRGPAHALSAMRIDPRRKAIQVPLVRTPGIPHALAVSPGRAPSPNQAADAGRRSATPAAAAEKSSVTTRARPMALPPCRSME